MNFNRIANILYNMSLDMDYADNIEYMDEEISALVEALEILDKNMCACMLNTLENIALKNANMENWAQNMIGSD